TDTEGKPHRLGRILAEKLTTEIVKKSRASVLDRLMFEKTLQENNLSLTGSLDVTLSKKVGDILKVDAVIMGIIHPFGSGVDINCRVIDTRTGIILSAEEAYYPTGQDE
ncbi:MAG: curli production assembly/transport component CsgG domain protein, partial [Leptospira sp.]|nr:curli production assembly/transport component CsgG domain protein [Leptospira sp.]